MTELAPVRVAENSSNSGSGYGFVVLDGHIMLGKGSSMSYNATSVLHVDFVGLPVSSRYLLENWREKWEAQQHYRIFQYLCCLISCLTGFRAHAWPTISVNPREVAVITIQEVHAATLDSISFHT